MDLDFGNELEIKNLVKFFGKVNKFGEVVTFFYEKSATLFQNVPKSRYKLFVKYLVTLFKKVKQRNVSKIKKYIHATLDLFVPTK